MNKPATLTVSLGNRSYPIVVGPGLLSSPIPAQIIEASRVCLVTNTTILPLIGARLAEGLRAAGKTVIIVALPDGEAYKSHETLNRIYDAMLDAALDRKSCVVALGGGVVGDMAGFAAATYQRGIPFIQIPTTLLAQVDSSVGGKTAINHAKGKNMIGAFHQPRAVIIDTDTLATLPERELRAGLAEVIKYGLIRDSGFLSWLEQNMTRLVARDAKALEHAVLESCRNKAEVVAADELEVDERALLNLGHTFGHAIEGVLGFGVWLHGEAVAAGMMLAAELSTQLGHIAESDVARIRSLLSAAGLPVQPPKVSASDLLAFMDVDKKNDSGRIRLILLKSVGNAYIEDKVSRETLQDFLSTRLAASS